MSRPHVPSKEHAPQSERAQAISFSAAVVAACNALVGLVVSFGLDLTGAQQAQIMATVNAIVILVVAFSHWYSERQRERERWSHLNGY